MSERKPHIFLDMPTHPDDPTPAQLVVKWLTDEELQESK